MTATTSYGRLKVLALLLDEAFEVLQTIEPESSDESRRLAILLAQIADALATVRKDPDGVDVDIDAAHFRLTGD